MAGGQVYLHSPGGYPLLMHVLPETPNQEKHIQDYFKSRGIACGVTAVRRCTYEGYFDSHSVFEDLKNYTHPKMILDNGLELVFIPWMDSNGINSAGSSYSSSLMDAPSEQKKLNVKQLDETNKQVEKENWKQLDVFTNEIFPLVTANLNTDLFTKAERQQIRSVYPNIKILTSTPDNGIEKVSGNYNDIANVFKYFEDLQKRKQENREISHSESNDNFGFKEKSESINVLSAHYEYFNHVCRQEIEKLQQQFCVKLEHFDISNDDSSLCFIALSKKSNVDRAQQLFIKVFQKSIEDLSQEIIQLPDGSQLDDMVHILNETCRRVLTKKDINSLILRGPKQEILCAKEFLEQVAFKKSLDAKPKNVAIDLDQYYDIIAILSKDIEEIKSKYSVSVQFYKTHDRKVNVIFTSMTKDLDLSVHAYEHFISAFQKVVTNIKAKVIKLTPASRMEKLQKCIDQSQKDFCNVRFRNKGETLIIIGLQHHVMAAEKQLNVMLDNKELSEGKEVPESSYKIEPDCDPVIPMEVDAHDPFKVYSFTERKHLKSKDVAMKEHEDRCPICLEIPKGKVTLKKCKHKFCEQCLKTAMSHKPVCPVCRVPYGIIVGDQPDGKMSRSIIFTPLPGYTCGTIVIDYSIPDGIQGEKHPNPGQRFQGTHRTAYLPDNVEGREILNLLEKAFRQKLIFTVGHSHTTGAEDVVTWNDIHHKTNMKGGPQRYGYPDPEYLKRVREELKTKGIE